MQKLSISLIAIAMCMPAIADPVTPNIAVGTNPASCTESVLETTSGTSNLQAAWTPNTLYLNWTSDGDSWSPNNTSAVVSCTYDSGITVPSNNPTKTGYTFAGWKVKSSNILLTLNLSTDGINYYGRGFDVDYNEDVCSMYPTTYANSANCSLAEFNDLSAGEWKTEFSYGTIYGEASCQSLDADMEYLINNLYDVYRGESNPYEVISGYTAIAGAEKGAILTDIFTRYSNGALTNDQVFGEVYGKLLSSNDSKYNKNTMEDYHCFCKATAYKPLNSTKQNVTGTLWVALGGLANGPEYCRMMCAINCAYSVSVVDSDRSAIFGLYQ